MTSYKRVLLPVLFACAFLLGLAAVFFLPKSLNAVAEEEDAASDVASVDGVIYQDFDDALANWKAGTTLTLLASVETDTITINEEKTLDLNGRGITATDVRTFRIEANGDLTLNSGDADSGWLQGGVYLKSGSRFTMNDTTRIVSSSAENGGGVYVEDGASFTMNDDAFIVNCTVPGNGGGVYVADGGIFTMNGGRISANYASGNGSGVFLSSGGILTVSGKAFIMNNYLTDSYSELGNNLYLSNGVTFAIAEEFQGRIYLTMTQPGLFSYSKPQNVAFVVSDDKLYKVVEKSYGLVLELCPLASVSAEIEEDVRIFPTTEIQTIKQYISVSGLNENGVEYPAEIDFKISGELHIGESDITVTATGQGGEVVTGQLKVQVIAPNLEEIEVSYSQQAVYYFDSDFESLHRELTVTGHYEDGFTRRIMNTAEGTTAENGEEYITNHYTLLGSFAEHENGKAQMQAVVMNQDGEELEKGFEVNISKQTFYTSELRVSEVKILEGSGTQVTAEDFTPDLRWGVLSSIKLKGKEGPIDSTLLPSGIYIVEVSFYPENEKNCEVLGPALETRLLVYAPEYRGTANGFSYVITAEGGISPEWVFSLKKANPTVYLERGYSMDRAFEITFFPWESKDLPQSFTVSILLDESLLQENLYFYRVAEDGSIREVAFNRQGDYLVFSAYELNQTCFFIAVENNDSLLLALAITFGVLCLLGAGVYLWYLLHKRIIYK